MKISYTITTVLLVGLILIFSFQNLKMVTISFLSMRATLPLAILALLVYSLGVATGGVVLSLVSSLVRSATATKKPQ